MKFVKLTGADGEPRWIRAEAIVDFRQYEQGDDEWPRLTCIACLGGYSPSVRETPEEILALLAEPPSVEVTAEAVEAAERAYLAQIGEGWVSRFGIRAAIVAADRARGLR